MLYRRIIVRPYSFHTACGENYSPFSVLRCFRLHYFCLILLCHQRKRKSFDGTRKINRCGHRYRYIAWMARLKSVISMRIRPTIFRLCIGMQIDWLIDEFTISPVRGGWLLNTLFNAEIKAHNRKKILQEKQVTYMCSLSRSVTIVLRN